MSTVLVEFHSARSEGSWRIKKNRRRRRMTVKPKSADDYVRRPKDVVTCFEGHSVDEIVHRRVRSAYSRWQNGTSLGSSPHAHLTLLDTTELAPAATISLSCSRVAEDHQWQWERGHAPRAALCRGRHFEGPKYGIQFR